MVEYYVRWVALQGEMNVMQTGVSIHQAENELEMLRKINRWNIQMASVLESDINKNKSPHQTYFLYYLDGKVDSKLTYY